MKNNFKGILVFCAGLAIINLALPAHAELKNPNLPNRDGVKLWKIKAHSAFRTEEELDTNIYLSDKNGKFDAITVLWPSVGLEVPFREGSLSCDYDVDIHMYSTYHKESHVNQRIRALADIKFSRFDLKIADVYRDYIDRRTDENSARVKRKINSLKANVSSEFELLGFDLGYENRFDVYDSEDIIFGPLNYRDKSTVWNVIRGTVSYRILPKTKLIMESDFGLINYYESSLPPNSFYIEPMMGIRGEWLKKINIDLKIGFRFQDYGNSDVMNDKSYIGPVAYGGFEYLVTDRDTVTFGIQKTIYESTFTNANYYDVLMILLDYKRQFNDKLSAKIFGSYQLNLYPNDTTVDGETAKRHDNIFGGGALVRYDIRKWLAVDAKYEYRQRVSKFETYDYVDNIVTFGGTAGF